MLFVFKHENNRFRKHSLYSLGRFYKLLCED